MKNEVSYMLEIKDEYRCFYDTISIYRDVLTFLINVVEDNYDVLETITTNEKRSMVEHLVHTTEKNEAKYKAFDKKFGCLPFYFMREAINTALGIVASHRANLKLWEEEGRKSKKPRLKVNRNEMPCFYKNRMFRLTEDGDHYACKLKLRIDNSWDWKEFTFRKTDLEYIEKKGFDLRDAQCPILVKKGKRFALRFFFTDMTELASTKDRILACDIGINHAATLAVMEEDGTVIARKFVSFPIEEDRLNTILNELRRAHSDSACHTCRLNRFSMNYNEALSKKTANAIVETAIAYGCSVIVMESLKNKMGKKHGKKAYRLSLWRKKDVEKRVERLAHSHGLRFSTVGAINTSRLAFDGSGVVTRDKKNRSICTFKTGKVYNCDLSASYNIGARYFAREIWKALPETVASMLKANVPELWYGVNCTLSTLIDLYAVKAFLS